ncbi:MAG: glutathione-dependent formaldehyde dehydrogenase [Thermobacillus sp. ZCTH02-B1]|uniref:zinc-dependent alcohol dehydrogenase n=1 Tax=Thermobacillus sp. ZCTH02-B1 TaxID=1858795 RepID=UPI000B575A79|nr:zinc-dependent alcohol dehydrogenase [Thermobacillus sp. ZCTH02-B1]OUM97181.1 MAG: glutathione-dependent formaldehyde dehydrogenase [Thermobacillus sp. ZCTH02-B1]
MKAVTYQGVRTIEVKEVPEPRIERPDDVIVRLTASGICGSDLHLVSGMVPDLPKDFVLGHEPLGIVEEVGPEVRHVKKGDRVVIPFNVSCGECFYCRHGLESQCDNANENAEVGAVFGFSEEGGGFPGAQAEYLRVPYGNYLPFRVPEDCELTDERLVLISDVLPTAYWSAENAGVKPGVTVVVLGCGPIGLATQKMCWLMGAERVIAVEAVDYRLDHARRTNRVDTVKFESPKETGYLIKEMTGGGADIVIDCVGMEAKMTPLEYVETMLKIQGGSLSALSTAVQAVRKGGVIQVTGLYGMRYNGFPYGDIYSRNVTLKGGLAPAVRYMPVVYDLMAQGRLDPADIVTHVMPLSEAKEGYEIFAKRKQHCIKVILRP